MEDELRKATLPLVAQVRNEPHNLIYTRIVPRPAISSSTRSSPPRRISRRTTRRRTCKPEFARLPELAEGGVAVTHMQMLSEAKRDQNDKASIGQENGTRSPAHRADLAQTQCLFSIRRGHSKRWNPQGRLAPQRGLRPPSRRALRDFGALSSTGVGRRSRSPRLQPSIWNASALVYKKTLSK